MIGRVLSHAPTWVFALFLVLLVFGLMQTRTRTVGRIPALLLPAGVIALSIAGIQSSFGLVPVPVAPWAIALAIPLLSAMPCFATSESATTQARRRTSFLAAGSRSS